MSPLNSIPRALFLVTTFMFAPGCGPPCAEYTTVQVNESYCADVAANGHCRRMAFEMKTRKVCKRREGAASSAPARRGPEEELEHDRYVCRSGVLDACERQHMFATAAEWREKLCAGHQGKPPDASACRELGEQYDVGQVVWPPSEEVKRDPARAQRLFKRGCELGDRTSCNLENRDGAAAAERRLTSCRSGSALACKELAHQFEFGLGIPKDLEEAAESYRRSLEIYERSCAGGEEPRDCQLAAHLYRDGAPGVPKDPARAQTLYKRGCELGAATSCAYAEQPAP